MPCLQNYMVELTKKSCIGAGNNKNQCFSHLDSGQFSAEDTTVCMLPEAATCKSTSQWLWMRNPDKEHSSFSRWAISLVSRNRLCYSTVRKTAKQLLSWFCRPRQQLKSICCTILFAYLFLILSFYLSFPRSTIIRGVSTAGQEQGHLVSWSWKCYDMLGQSWLKTN